MFLNTIANTGLTYSPNKDSKISKDLSKYLEASSKFPDLA